MESDWEIRRIRPKSIAKFRKCSEGVCMETATFYLVLLPREGTMQFRESRTRRCEKHARDAAQRMRLKFPEEAEACIQAAVKMTDGEIIRGRRHHDCLTALRERGTPVEEIRAGVQGFWTNRGRFVDRHEGIEIQRASGLPSKYSKDGEYHGDILFSEDLC